ncbi:MAG: carboxypeptidase-like regulatory domain-containing protein [Candidatus Cyclobacteriaceae bacterium M3_2C_046]
MYFSHIEDGIIRYVKRNRFALVKHYVILIWGILLSHGLLAQDDQVKINGTVVSGDSLEPVPFVHIIDKIKNLGTSTDEDGRFSLKVPVGDTLLFSAIGYYTHTYIVPDTDQDEIDVIIKLRNRIYQLKPIDIYAYDLEEMFNQMKKKDEVDLKNPKGEPMLPEKERKEVPAINLAPSMAGGARLEGAVTAFANLFNKEFQQRKRLKEIIAEEEARKNYQEYIRLLQENYKDIAQKITRLEQDEFNDFIALYMPSLSFLEYAEEYDIVVKVHKDFQDYRYKFKLEEISLNELLENAQFKK